MCIRKIYKIFTFVFFFVVSANLYASDNIKINTSYLLTKQDLDYESIKKLDNFIPSGGNNFGIIDDFCILKIVIENKINKDIKRVFQFKTPFMDRILVYDEDYSEVQKYGQLEVFNSNINSLNNASFVVFVKGNSSKIIYIKLKSTFAMKTFMSDFNENEYQNNIIFQKRIFDFVYGVLLSMVLYNFFIWISIKEKSYFYYVVFHFVFILGIISWNGFGFEYFWPNTPLINQYTYGVLGNLIYAFNILFIIYFLNTNLYLPRVTKCLKFCVLILVCFSISSLFVQLTTLYEIFSIFTTIVTLLLMIYLINVEKLKIAIYIFISKIFLIFGNFLLLLSEFAIIDGSFWIDNFYIFGACFEVILMSFALAYKYKYMEVEKEQEKLKRIATENMIIGKHKLSILGEMMNILVHQWRQPLSQVNSIVYSIENDYLNKTIDTKTLDSKINNIEAITHYLSQTINDFRNFSVNDNTKSKFLIEELIEEVLSIFTFTFKSYNINIEVQYSNPNINVFSNRNELSQVFMIILTNAKDAFIDNEIKNAKIFFDVTENADTVTIEISNNAGAIEENILAKIFDLSFSTKKFQDGSGLGLYIAKLILDKLNASITVNTHAPYTSFIIKGLKSN